MSNLEKMQNLLQSLQVPARQQTELCAYTLLAMSDIKKTTPWKDASNNWIRIHDILVFLKKYYKKEYAENSREIFRKQALHHFRTAAFIEDNGKATNSSDYRYRITDEFIKVIRGAIKADDFLSNHESLVAKYSSKKKLEQVPVIINGIELNFSTGKHNELQKAIIEEFGSRFAKGSECLYVGDTTEKDLVKNVEKLNELGFEITLHNKMPDVVLYDGQKNWLYFIEAVTSVGPMDSKRIIELTELTKNVKSGKIFVTAFLDFKTYKKFADTLAWDTEVWIAEMPDHMIHLNGDRFMGPRG
ncbi:MAG: restriction endonuclease [Bacteroidales bacterium]|nr:restriction endonuclease [Bacteroidales bacterium]